MKPRPSAQGAELLAQLHTDLLWEAMCLLHRRPGRLYVLCSVLGDSVDRSEASQPNLPYS